MKHHSVLHSLNFCVDLSVKIPFNKWSNLNYSLSSCVFWLFQGRGKEMSSTLKWMGGDKPKGKVSIQPISKNQWINWAYTEEHGWLKDTCITRKSPGRLLVSYTNKESVSRMYSWNAAPQYSWLTCRDHNTQVLSPQSLLSTYTLTYCWVGE